MLRKTHSGEVPGVTAVSSLIRDATTPERAAKARRLCEGSPAENAEEILCGSAGESVDGGSLAASPVRRGLTCKTSLGGETPDAGLAPMKARDGATCGVVEVGAEPFPAVAIGGPVDGEGVVESPARRRLKRKTSLDGGAPEAGLATSSVRDDRAARSFGVGVVESPSRRRLGRKTSLGAEAPEVDVSTSAARDGATVGGDVEVALASPGGGAAASAVSVSDGFGQAAGVVSSRSDFRLGAGQSRLRRRRGEQAAGGSRSGAIVGDMSTIRAE